MRAPTHLLTVAEARATRGAVQKGAMATRLEDKDADRKADEKKSKAFRAAVWKRDGGKCRICHRLVKRTLDLEPLRGEVHHLRGRNVTPADRYNVAAALLLCKTCHDNAGAKKVKVPRP